ncbi:MAG: amidohydrolase, partial [Proteobacteria bacterium]|nr:amidohydrolase [Pseudomonadota bacterium]
RALHLEKLIGSLEMGKEADIIAVSLKGPHCFPLYDPYSHLVYSATGADVLHTLVGGKILMKNRKMMLCDENDILNRAQKWGLKIARLNAKFQKA